MDTFNDKPLSDSQPSPSPAGNTTTGEIESLRQLVISTLVLVFILSGAFNIYLWRQYKGVRQELAPLEPQATQIVAECNRVNGMAQDVVKRFIEYGRTHPDFQPTLAKFGVSVTNVPPAAPSTKLTPPPAKK